MHNEYIEYTTIPISVSSIIEISGTFFNKAYVTKKPCADKLMTSKMTYQRKEVWFLYPMQLFKYGQ